MVRFPLELTLPVSLLLLQLLWSYVYQYLPDELPLLAEHAPKEAEAPNPAAPTATQTDEESERPAGNDEVVLSEKSVKWLTPDGENRQVSSFGLSGTTELPLFPLGTTFHALDSHPTLQIFEPRYRQLYHDVLSSGQRTFVVTATDPETARLASYGVIFQVDQVVDVAEKTGGKIKYIAEHTVKSRVQIHRVIEDRAEQKGYLRVSASPVEDDSDDADELHDLEAEVTELFSSLVQDVDDLQAEVAARGLRVNASREGGLWQLASLWLDKYAGHRVRAIEQQMLSQVKEIYEQYASQHMQESINPSDMPPSVHGEVRELKSLFDAEILRLVGEQVSLGQLLLQSRSHKERLHLLRSAFQVERLFAAAADPESMAAAFVG
mmetsp:Transcript_65811/g.154006  ORF Transcript_65811/g.154006 Transcript_65811/m.154006 type:complete len:379 (+) Transcript_65811:55-1191(+)